MPFRVAQNHPNSGFYIEVHCDINPLLQGGGGLKLSIQTINSTGYPHPPTIQRFPFVDIASAPAVKQCLDRWVLSGNPNTASLVGDLLQLSQNSRVILLPAWHHGFQNHHCKLSNLRVENSATRCSYADKIVSWFAWHYVRFGALLGSHKGLATIMSIEATIRET